MMNSLSTYQPKSRLKGKNLKISGVAHYFPGKPINNDYFEENFGMNNEWIIKNTGVESRHFANSLVERHSEMGAKAAISAIEKAGINPTDIDLIIGTSSTSRPTHNPSSINNNYMDIAPIVQNLIGATNALAFDVSALACSGFLGASVVAQGLITSMDKKNALIICSESPEDIMNFKYKNSCLFGAGATAFLWTVDDLDVGLLDIVMHTDGKYFDAFNIDEEAKMIMNGKLVGAVAPVKLIEVLTEILHKNMMTIDDIDWFVPHQANINLINTVSEDLKIPTEKVLVNLPYRGNTSSVGMPSCISENIENRKIKKGDIILSCTIGRGFTWAASLIRY